MEMTEEVAQHSTVHVQQVQHTKQPTKIEDDSTQLVRREEQIKSIQNCSRSNSSGRDMMMYIRRSSQRLSWRCTKGLKYIRGYQKLVVVVVKGGGVSATKTPKIGVSFVLPSRSLGPSIFPAILGWQ